MLKQLSTGLLAISLAILGAIAPALAGKAEKTGRIVANAEQTAKYFATDDVYDAMWDLATDAKAMVIIPSSIRAGFIFGGAAGDAVMLARNVDNTWSQPVFMTTGSFSFGLQAGGEQSEIILLVMTNRGKEQLLSTSVKLGADISIAAGPLGGGGKAQTTDILAFSRSRGVYGGLSLEGAVLKIRHSYNRAFYRAEVTPTDILYRQKAYNPAATPLQAAVKALAERNNIAHVPVDLDRPALPSNAPQSAPQPGPQQYEDDQAWGAPVKQ